MSADTLNGTSLWKDGHENILSGISPFNVSNKEINRFRLDLLKLVCEVTCKFHTMKKVASSIDKQCTCSDQCDCTTNYNNGCDVQWDDGSVDSSHMSMTCGPSVSNHFDRTYAYERTLSQRCAVIYFITRQSDVIVIYTQKLSNFT